MSERSAGCRKRCVLTCAQVQLSHTWCCEHAVIHLPRGGLICSPRVICLAALFANGAVTEWISAHPLARGCAVSLSSVLNREAVCGLVPQVWSWRHFSGLFSDKAHNYQISLNKGTFATRQLPAPRNQHGERYFSKKPEKFRICFF